MKGGKVGWGATGGSTSTNVAPGHAANARSANIMTAAAVYCASCGIVRPDEKRLRREGGRFLCGFVFKRFCI